MREFFTNHHDKARVRHDERIRPHINHRLKVTDEGFQLRVVRLNVTHHIEFFTQCVGFINADL
ncbi:Uncharacterised protein [Vibrio cholerae]|nr:Uncharacterised protein [Vibrio cholerae]